MRDPDVLVNDSFIYAIFGFVFILIAVISVCVGKTFGRYGLSAARTKQPTQFWWGVVIYLVGGISFIGVWLRSIFPAPILHPELWMHLK